MKIGLIGHSHSVCLLDAQGAWRDQLGAASQAKREGFSAAYRGWDATDTGKKVIRFPGRKFGPYAADLLSVVIFGGSRDYALVDAGVGGEKNVAIAPTATLLEACQAFRECAVIVSVLFGNELAMKIWVDNYPPYDFLDEETPEPVRPGARPIDRRYISQSVNESAGRALLTCSVMRQLCPRARFIHVPPPPPLEDPTGVEHREGFDQAFAQFGALPALLRLKWYRTYIRAARMLLTQAGIALAPTPPEAFDARGFFKPSLADGLTHGNVAYGRMMWEAIGQVIGTFR